MTVTHLKTGKELRKEMKEYHFQTVNKYILKYAKYD